MDTSITLEQIRQWEARLRNLDNPICREGEWLCEQIDAGYAALGLPPQDWANFWPRYERREPKPKTISKPDMRADVWDKTGGRCWYCGVQTNPWRDFCVDHFLAKAAGGADTLDNLVPCCRTCNMRKGPRGIEALRRRLAGDGTPAFTPAQLEYLYQQGITVPNTMPAFQFYFERIGVEGEAG